MASRSFIRRRDAQYQAFLKWTRDEINADRQAGLDGARKPRTAVRIAHAVEDFRRKTRRYGDRREALLTNQRPADRGATTGIRFAWSGKLSRGHCGHRGNQRVEPLFLHTLQK